ncbi:MAG: DUF4037 domain-containing protein [Caldilineaceae bacterium]
MPSMQGIELCRQFYWEAVRPILAWRFPGLAHAAALLGPGSEVLGFDDAMSTDHHWGPRCLLFLNEDDHAQLARPIHHALAHELPVRFGGFSTHFSEPDAEDSGVQLLETIESGPVNHRVEVWTQRGFIRQTLNFELPASAAIEPADWLTFPQQRLRTIVDGAVYHDEIGLAQLRERFAWYPLDVWRYLLAAGWARIGQEEHLMGRAGLAGDEVGSALIGARLVRDVMQLCFLMARVYAPYPKWFGTAFKQLPCAAELYPLLQQALAAPTWQARGDLLAAAYEKLAVLHNALGLTEPMPTQTRDFFGRPFRVMALHGFGDALLQDIQDPVVRQIAQRRPIGSIDQFSDSTDLLEGAEWRTAVRALYQ